MELSKRSYPHPVVGTPDDVPEYGFQFTVVEQVSAQEVRLAVEVASSCPTVNRLVKAGKAVFTLHVECGRTLFRQAFPSTDWPVCISTDRLAGRVELCGFLVATQQIRRYRVDGAHPRFGDATFTVEPGDVLAVAAIQPITLDPRDPLTRIGSIFHVQRAKEPGDRPVEANTLTDKIVITLSQPDADQYALLKANPALKTLAATVFILPVLVRAVQELTSDPGLRDQRTWADVIGRRAEELGLDLSDPLRAAQELYGRPVARAFRAAQAPVHTGEWTGAER